MRHSPYCKIVLEDVTLEEQRDGDTIMRRIITPAGTITETSLHIPGAETDFITKPFIKTPADYDAVCFLLTHQHVTPDYPTAQRTIDETGEDGLVTIDAGAPPLSAFFRYLAQEQVLYESHDHPEQLDRLAAAVHEHQLAMCRAAAAAPAEVVIAYSADITTRLISPRLFERYALPYLQEYAAILHAADKLFIIHTCGDVRALLPLMRQANIDGIDSLSEPPLGNTPFEVAMAELGDDVCLIGGVSPIVLANGTPAQVREHVLDLFSRVPHRRNLLLCTSDATAFATPVENLRAVAELVKEY
ncbi:MAG: methylcobalamin:coenzyme M methyltransferase [Chloroflexi bacterium ADurb.Bin325]|nr:MAG: methylcobalamin:coenzyme M methyltransferase [Chloroflexi bacterium ADurb.Bin325]